MKFTLYILILLLYMGSWKLQSQDQNQHPIALDSAVRYGKLDNGFTYYLRKNDDPKNSTELRLMVKAGRMHEDEDQLEYAHLLEHLVASQTKNYPRIKTHFDKFGGNSNAGTDACYTIYKASLPSKNKQGIKEGLKILLDWASNDNEWEPEYIGVQRAAIQGEARTTDPYRKWVYKTIESEVLKKSGYKIYSDEKRLTNLENFKPEAFERFYKDWYRPDLQAAIVVGAIDVDSMEHEIRRLFSDLKTSQDAKNAQRRLITKTMQFDGCNQFSTVVDSMRQELKLKIVRTRPNFQLQPKSRQDYRQMLLQQLYANLIDDRKRQLLQQYDPPFSNFDSNYRSNEFPGGQLNASLMSIELEPDDLQDLKSDFQRGLVAWKQMNLEFNQTDLIKAKEKLLKNYTSDQSFSSTSIIQKLESHFVYGKVVLDPERETTLASEILSKIELRDIREYVLEYGGLNKNINYIFFKGTNLTMPDYGLFKQWIKETDTMTLAPLPPKKVIRTLNNLVDITPSAPLKDFEVIENEIGVSTVKLSNGIKLVLKPTTPRRDDFAGIVSIQAFRKNKIPINNRQEYLAAKVAPEVLQYTGAGPYTKFDLEQFMQEKGIKLRFQTNMDNQMIYAASKTDELPELFNLLYLFLDQPRIDQKAFDGWKYDQKEQLEGKGLRGSESFIMKKINSKWYPQIPVLEKEDLQKLSMKKVFQASKKWFSSIENYTFIVTGDFDKNKLAPILVNTLSSFPVKEKNLPTLTTEIDFPLKSIKKNQEYKNTAQVYTKLFFPVQAPRNIKTQIELQLLSKALGRRIYDRLRNGCYAPSARGEWTDIQNGIYTFRIEFDSELGNEDKMKAYALEEFRKLRKNGVEKEWLKTAVTNELRSYEGRFGSFGYFNFWPDYLQLKLENGEDPVPGILNYGTLLEHFIKLEDINTAAKKYLKEEHLQQFLGYPEGYHAIK